MSAKPRPSFKHVVSALASTQKLRRALRRPSGFQFVIADAIDLLNGVLWDQATRHVSFFLRRDYLRMLEQAGPENIAPRYVLICQEGVPLAAVYLQIIDVSGDNLGARREYVPVVKGIPSLVQKIFSPAKRGLRTKLRQRVLVCGNFLTYGFHGVAFAPSQKERDLWPAVAEAIYRIRRAEKLSGQTDFILIKDITPNEAGQIDILSHLSYRALETEPNMVLELRPEWQTYDDYAASLASKYRSAARQQIHKPMEAAGCAVVHLDNLAEHEERLHALYMQVHEKAALRPFTLPADYFSALEQCAGDNLRCAAIRKDDDIIGFIITLKDGDTAYGYHIGFDRKASESLPVYLKLLHTSIADAIAFGCRRLSLGRTALEPKASLGAKPEPINVWVRHRQPVMNLFVRNLLGVISHDEAPERNPFKKTA